MIEVFKTDVQYEAEAFTLVEKLRQSFPHCKINFDLQDCDRILRIEGNNVQALDIIQLMATKGYFCEALN